MVICYLICFIISMFLTVVFMFRRNQRTNIYISLMFALGPITQMGYLMLSLSSNLQEALLAIKIVYLFGCFLLLFITLAIMDMMNIDVHPAIPRIMVIVSMIMYGSVLSIGFSDLFYVSAEYEVVHGIVNVKKVYGPMHTVFYIVVSLYFLFSIGLLINSLRKKKPISRKLIYGLLGVEILSFLSYFGLAFMPVRFELQPIIYVLFQLVFLMFMERASLNDIELTQGTALVETNEDGFIALDRKNRYVGANKQAIKMFPEIEKLEIDKVPEFKEEPLDQFSGWLKEFINDVSKPLIKQIEFKDNYYRFVFNAITDAGIYRGVQVVIIDETRERRYELLLKQYNEQLNEEVNAKTRYIYDIQGKMLLGLADMVENRDTNTGGHIKRTSTAIEILVNEMMKDPASKVDYRFGTMLIKAAPMHDLGKIAVDDAILRKPGRFTPEEFEIMKTHAAKGAKIVHNVLEGIQEEDFAQLAENVAHYHHERWDGSGYPDHLKGEEIPYEARIMAIADVYDALVSKRCYKDAMSFEDAYKIIEEGMGTQFDPSLNKYFIACRKQLEDYYKKEAEKTEQI